MTLDEFEALVRAVFPTAQDFYTALGAHNAAVMACDEAITGVRYALNSPDPPWVVSWRIDAHAGKGCGETLSDALVECALDPIFRGWRRTFLHLRADQSRARGR